MIILRLRPWLLAALTATGTVVPTSAFAQEADLILHNGKIVTADRAFTISHALAVKGDRLLRVGTERGSARVPAAPTRRSSTWPARPSCPV